MHQAELEIPLVLAAEQRVRAVSDDTAAPARDGLQAGHAYVSKGGCIWLVRYVIARLYFERWSNHGSEIGLQRCILGGQSVW